VKSARSAFTYNALSEERDEPVKQLKRIKVGRQDGQRARRGWEPPLPEKKTRTVDTVWAYSLPPARNKREWVYYETQKPVNLLERIVRMASNPGDLVLDAFVGSGTTAIACERIGRRWIVCDRGRFSIHHDSKRLLVEEHCRPLSAAFWKSERLVLLAEYCV